MAMSSECEIMISYDTFQNIGEKINYRHRLRLQYNDSDSYGMPEIRNFVVRYGEAVVAGIGN